MLFAETSMFFSGQNGSWPKCPATEYMTCQWLSGRSGMTTHELPYCRGRGEHVRIAKVQHTLTKAVHALGCLYSVIIMSNYSRFIMPVKKLQFPPWKTDKFESVKVCPCADMPHHEGHVRTPCCYVVIAYISTFVNLCMHITWCYMLTHIIIEAYIHVHYDYVFIKNIYDK